MLVSGLMLGQPEEPDRGMDGLGGTLNPEMCSYVLDWKRCPRVDCGPRSVLSREAVLIKRRGDVLLSVAIYIHDT